jgi:hypothetical protein
MSSRKAKWVGGGLAAASAVGLAGYLSLVGLDEADKLASVIGAFIGLAGLALAVLGGGGGSEPVDEGDVHNEVSGGTFHGPVFQGRDFTVGSVEETGDEPAGD